MAATVLLPHWREQQRRTRCMPLERISAWRPSRVKPRSTRAKVVASGEYQSVTDLRRLQRAPLREGSVSTVRAMGRILSVGGVGLSRGGGGHEEEGVRRRGRC